MKEAVREKGGGNNVNARNALDKEKTKMRERQRRSITTNIFHGLRKHGGYRLSPRADINEVLRHLAHEAGWIVEPDGTTYRSSSAAAAATISNGTNSCPLCGGGRKGTTPTPSCSYLGGGGDCSTTASPRRVTVGDSATINLSAGGLPSISSSNVMTAHDTLLAIYMCGAAPQNACASDPACSAAFGNGKGQQLCLLQEGSVSNQNTPAGSP